MRQIQSKGPHAPSLEKTDSVLKSNDLSRRTGALCTKGSTYAQIHSNGRAGRDLTRCLIFPSVSGVFLLDLCLFRYVFAKSS